MMKRFCTATVVFLLAFIGCCYGDEEGETLNVLIDTDKANQVLHKLLSLRHPVTTTVHSCRITKYPGKTYQAEVDVTVFEVDSLLTCISTCHLYDRTGRKCASVNYFKNGKQCELLPKAYSTNSTQTLSNRTIVTHAALERCFGSAGEEEKSNEDISSSSSSSMEANDDVQTEPTDIVEPVTTPEKKKNTQIYFMPAECTGPTYRGMRYFPANQPSMVIKVREFDECGSLCWQHRNKGCLSFNYLKSTKTCELFDEAYSKNKGALSGETDSVYMEPEKCHAVLIDHLKAHTVLDYSPAQCTFKSRHTGYYLPGEMIASSYWVESENDCASLCYQFNHQSNKEYTCGSVNFYEFANKCELMKKKRHHFGVGGPDLAKYYSSTYIVPSKCELAN